MKRKHIFGLIIISFLLTNVVAYLDEGIMTFDYLMRLGDWSALLMYTVLFLLIPIFIFIRIKKSQKNKFAIALLGFVPPIFLILAQLGVIY